MKNIIRELLPYVLILGGVILIRTFIVTPVIVSGDSMKPNLHNGDLLLERKINYNSTNIKRFDIVVIKEGKEEIIKDYKLSRYICYLIIQNADPSKEVVALGQTYFAIQTRKQEITEQEYDTLSDDEKRFYQRRLIKQGNYTL